MKTKWIIVIISAALLDCLLASAQNDSLSGTVSYITSQNVYVRFRTTGHLELGDTLFLQQDQSLVPALLINHLSSISAVCTPLVSGGELATGMILLAKPAINQAPEVPAAPQQPGPGYPMDTTTAPAAEKDTGVKRPQLISGRLAIASYSNFSNADAPETQRMKYTLALNVKNIANSKFSAETYINFSHDNQHWDQIREDVFYGLKIYSLALRYDFDETGMILAGRKINPKLSSMGAIDGLQFEKKFGSFSFGIVAGSRPDYENYSLDFSLFQAGAYVSHDYARDGRSMQTSFAFIQQMNDWKTDRRFIYLQHCNTLVSNLFFMGTAEVDLYENIDSVASNAFRLSNLYLSLRYRVMKQLSFTLSYNARQNIIYYETYKNIIDQYLNDEALQGFRLQVNSSPFRNFSLGATAAYRYRSGDPNQTKNLYLYAGYSSVPYIDASITASFTLLEAGYLKGKIYSIGLSKDLFPGRLSAGINYRYVDYDYYNTEVRQTQNMAELNLMWRIYGKLSLSAYYEGTFEKVNSYNRIYLSLTQRF